MNCFTAILLTNGIALYFCQSFYLKKLDLMNKFHTDRMISYRNETNKQTQIISKFMNILDGRDSNKNVINDLLEITNSIETENIFDPMRAFEPFPST
jgi:hypothetical protein